MVRMKLCAGSTKSIAASVWWWVGVWMMAMMGIMQVGGQQTISFQLIFTGGQQSCTASDCTSGEVYVPYYACNDGRGVWNGGFINFWDPIPPTSGYVLWNATCIASGNFEFDESVHLVGITLIDGELIGETALPSTGTPCPNCAELHEFDPIFSFPNGWPNYQYGQNNSFQFMPTTGNTADNYTVCINYVNITFEFGPTHYAVLDITPKRGPRAGNTDVIVLGAHFEEAKKPLCSFGGKIVQGQWVNDTAIICNSPELNCPNGVYPCNVSVEIANEAAGFTFDGVNFTYFRADTPSKGKSPPLLWVYVAVGVCAGSVILVVAAGYIYAKRNTNNSARFVDEQSRLINSEKFKRYGSLHPIDISEILISQRIGRGSCAEVYMGLWRGTTVAIKKAKVFADDDEEFFTELAQEAEIMSALRHPNVLQFLGTASNPPELVIVMEFMSRGSLYRIIHDKSVELPWLRIKHMVLDISRGMNYLHCSDPIIIHRDLKSHNLLVDEHFKVKVCDFGLSTMVKRHLDKFTAMTPVGTPCWTAPEVLRNEPYSEKADVMWELITREDPYHGMPTFQIVIAVGQHNMRPIIPSTTSPTLTALITQCWSEDPGQRPSFADIVTRLEKM